MLTIFDDRSCMGNLSINRLQLGLTDSICDASCPFQEGLWFTRQISPPTSGFTNDMLWENFLVLLNVENT